MPVLLLMGCLCPAPISPQNRDCSCLSCPPLPTTRRYVPKADHRGGGQRFPHHAVPGEPGGCMEGGESRGDKVGLKREERCWRFLRSLNWAGGGSAWRESCASHGPRHRAPWRDPLPSCTASPSPPTPPGSVPPHTPRGELLLQLLHSPPH